VVTITTLYTNVNLLEICRRKKTLIVMHIQRLHSLTTVTLLSWSLEQMARSLYKGNADPAIVMKCCIRAVNVDVG
jgi:hypothetical protein